jgi:ElaB/YqjD/DUF883 family membrane-anchored ribosome-binding protein
MSDDGTWSGRFGRRALTGVAVLGIAAAGAVWSGCGDDSEDEVNEAIENANEQIESISEEAQQQAEEATDEALDEAEEAQDEAEQQLEDQGITTTTNP